MKKYLFLAIFFQFAICASSQTLLRAWQKSYGGSFPDYGRVITAIDNENLILWGMASSTDGDLPDSTKSGDIWRLEIDTNGSVIASNIYGINAEDDCNSVCHAYGGGFIVAGYNLNISDIYIKYIDDEKKLIWEKTYGGSSNDLPEKIIKTIDGNYLVVGSTFSNDRDIKFNHGYEDIWLLKLDQSGDTIWTNTIGGSGWDGCDDVISLPDSSFIITGSTSSTDGDFGTLHGGNDIYVIKLSKDGKIEWLKTYGGSMYDYVNCLYYTKDSNFILAGRTTSNDYDIDTNRGNSDAWIIKLDIKGDIIWSYTYGGTNNDEFVDIKEYDEENFIVLGFSSSSDGDLDTNKGNIDQWALIINQDGKLIFSESYGGSGNDYFSSSLKIENDLYILGHSDSNDGDFHLNFGNEDFSLSKHIIVKSIISVSSDFICKGDSISLVVHKNLEKDSIRYTWFKNGEKILTLDSILILKDIDFDDLGEYFCVLEDSSISDTTNKVYIDFSYNLKFDTTNICQGDSILVNNKYRKYSGSYTDTISVHNGCDSIITTLLVVYKGADKEINNSLCVGDSILINNTYIKNSGRYYDTLSTIMGCDSIIIYYLTFNQCETDLISNLDDIIIFPNPVSDFLYLDSYEFKYYEIYDMRGNKISSSRQNIIDMKLFNSGIYIIMIMDMNDKTMIKKIVVQK